MKRCYGILLVMFLLTPYALMGQANGKLTGTVKDAKDGDPIEGVEITINVMDTLLGTTSGAEGEYTIAKIPPGSYDVTYQDVRYGKKILNDVLIHAYRTTNKDIKLISSESKSLDVITIEEHRVFEKDKRTDSETIDAESMDKMPTKSVSNASTEEPKRSDREDKAAGQLTAGKIHDFSKWELWEDIADKKLKQYRETWGIQPVNRYTLQLTTPSGRPIVDAKVHLVNAAQKGDAPIWQARTDNRGRSELWAGLFDSVRSKRQNFQLNITYQDSGYTIVQVKSFKQGVNFYEIPVQCRAKRNVDILWAVDATGSMQDEIDYLQAELKNVTNRVKDTLPHVNLKTGSIFYRDAGEDYLTQRANFSANIEDINQFIDTQRAVGGGDKPEAVDSALTEALEMDWRSSAAARLLFLILDARPHDNPQVKERIQQLARKAARKGIRIIPVTASGITKSGEYLFRSLALATNGNYVFLTDDSGIGGDHIEPTTDDYDVKMLNTLLTGLIYQYAQMDDCDSSQSRQKPDTSLITQSPEQDTAQQDTTGFPDTSSSHEPEPAFSWEYYPNPTTGSLTIELSREAGPLFLTDLSGKVLKRYTIRNEPQLTVNIGNFSAGPYFLRLKHGEEWLTGKVILKGY